MNGAVARRRNEVDSHTLAKLLQYRRQAIDGRVGLLLELGVVAAGRLREPPKAIVAADRNHARAEGERLSPRPTAEMITPAPEASSLTSLNDLSFPVAIFAGHEKDFGSGHGAATG
jgi:hypothetical protein